MKIRGLNKPNRNSQSKNYSFMSAFVCSMLQKWTLNIKGWTILVVWSGGRGLRNLFTAAANHVAPSRRQGGDMIRHSREQVSKSPAT